MLRALAVARSESVVVYPDSTPLRRQLPLFLGAARSSVSYSFALTDDTGSRLFVYVHKEGDISFCAVSVQQQAALPLRHLYSGPSTAQLRRTTDTPLALWWQPPCRRTRTAPPNARCASLPTFSKRRSSRC